MPKSKRVRRCQAAPASGLPRAGQDRQWIGEPRRPVTRATGSAATRSGRSQRAGRARARGGSRDHHQRGRAPRSSLWASAGLARPSQDPRIVDCPAQLATSPLTSSSIRTATRSRSLTARNARSSLRHRPHASRWRSKAARASGVSRLSIASCRRPPDGRAERMGRMGQPRRSVLLKYALPLREIVQRHDQHLRARARRDRRPRRWGAHDTRSFFVGQAFDVHASSTCRLEFGRQLVQRRFDLGDRVHPRTDLEAFGVVVTGGHRESPVQGHGIDCAGFVPSVSPAIGQGSKCMMVNSQALPLVPSAKLSNVRYARSRVSCTTSSASWRGMGQATSRAEQGRCHRPATRSNSSRRHPVTSGVATFVPAPRLRRLRLCALRG